MRDKYKSMEQWGWTPFFSQQISTSLSLNQIARVIREERSHLLTINGEGNFVKAQIPGQWKKRSNDFENPGVGDWIVLEEMSLPPLKAAKNPQIFTVMDRLQRRSQILRQAAGLNPKHQLLCSNVDVAFIVSSCDHDFDVRRIERYLSLIEHESITPVLVLTKADEPNSFRMIEAMALRFEKYLQVTTRTDQIESIQDLAKHIGTGKTGVFLGSSGVGKSTLTNVLIGEDLQKVTSVRLKDSKGRHTTTGRTLHQISQNRGLIIDSPGLREVKLPYQTENLSEAFADIEQLSLLCRFTNCEHLTEPQCAVKEAIKEGQLNPQRLAHFIKLKTEMAQNKPWKNQNQRKKS